jgi:hypothetical protein
MIAFYCTTFLLSHQKKKMIGLAGIILFFLFFFWVFIVSISLYSCGIPQAIFRLIKRIVLAFARFIKYSVIVFVLGVSVSYVTLKCWDIALRYL